MKLPMQYAENHFDNFIIELKEFLRIPSVSTDRTYAKDMIRCVDWLADHLNHIGIREVEFLETNGHPIVSSELLEDNNVPTILIYGHYDVQPPDPLDLWESNPFEPIVRENKLFARGACDDKEQMFMILKAIQSILKIRGHFPCNLKIVLEGEEESGSAGLMTFVENYPLSWTSDIALACDTAMLSEYIPAITIALGGIVYAEILLQGSDRYLHSGVYGGAVENPLNGLSRLIAGLHDENHRVTLPGFYDDVSELNEREREMLHELPFDEQKWLGDIGVSGVKGEKGSSIPEATRIRPTLDVHGIWGGYAGEGTKAVIPAKAGAKLSCRMVANQDPATVFKGMASYFDTATPKTMKHELRLLGSGAPVRMNIAQPSMQAAVDALQLTFHNRAYFKWDGGSIPGISKIKQALGLGTILIGFGLESEAIHAPNGHFGLNRFRKGIEAIIRFFETYPQMHQNQKGK
jgi:acetylornithine deacetylase/succinyl-diaminopimelate desuccinylase-like protein